MSLGFPKRTEPKKKQTESSVAENSELHGFVCPECMKSYLSSEELMTHFDSHNFSDLPKIDSTTTHDSDTKDAVCYSQLLEEMSEHNKLLLEQLSGNTRRICELETAFGMLVGDSPAAPGFAFSDKELERKVIVFLDKQTKLATMESILEVNREELAQKNREIDQLQTRLAQLDGSLTDKPNADEITNLQAQLDASKLEDGTSAAATVSSLETELQSVRQELHTMQSALNASEARCVQLTEQLKRPKPMAPPVTTAGCQTDQTVEDEENKIDSTELTSAHQRIAELTAELNRATTELNELHAKLVQRDTDRLSADEKARDQIAQLTDSLRTSQIELTQVRSTYEAQISYLTEESSRLKTACDDHVRTTTQLLSARDALSQQVEELKGQCDELELKRTRDQDSWATERSTLTVQLSQLKQTADQLQTTKDNLEKQCTELTQQVTNHQSVISANEAKLMEQVKDGEQKLAETQVQLQSSKNEVNSLLERLIAAEDQCNRQAAEYQSQTEEIECLKKAIFELGRENQSLQMLRERIINRQWTKDDNILHCSVCHVEFSLTNRKHHCRQCGGIFCHTCSSHRASIAASKDPVRVCDPCYAELTGTGPH